MKPDVSLISAPDRAVEVRKPLTAKQRAELALAQKGICGCGCGGKLDHAREGTVDEHVIALGLMGANDLANRSLWRKPCSDAKTYGKDLPAIAKAKRIEAREEGTRRPRKPIANRVNAWPPKGSVKLPTKKSLRAQVANDDAAHRPQESQP